MVDAVEPKKTRRHIYRDRVGKRLLGESIWSLFQARQMKLLTLRFTKEKDEQLFHEYFARKRIQHIWIVFGITSVFLSLQSLFAYLAKTLDIFKLGTILRSFTFIVLLSAVLVSVAKSKTSVVEWYSRLSVFGGTVLLLFASNFIEDRGTQSTIITNPEWILILFSAQAFGLLLFLDLVIILGLVFTVHLTVYGILIENWIQRGFFNSIGSYVAVALASIFICYSREIYLRKKFILNIDNQRLPLPHSPPSNLRDSIEDCRIGCTSGLSAVSTADQRNQVPFVSAWNIGPGPFMTRLRRLLFLELPDQKIESLFLKYYNIKAIQQSNRQFFLQALTDIAIVLAALDSPFNWNGYFVLRITIPASIYLFSYLIGLIPYIAKRPTLIQCRNVLVVYIVSSGYIFQVHSAFRTQSPTGGDQMYYILVSQFASIFLTSTCAFNLRVRYLSILCLLSALTLVPVVCRHIQQPDFFFIFIGFSSYVGALISSWLFEKEVRTQFELKMKQEADKESSKSSISVVAELQDVHQQVA